MSRSRAYCFTLNNYSEQELSSLLSTPCTYLVVGKEEGAEGTPHLQGYIYFPNGKTLSSLKKISPRAHWELAKGDSLQNYNYCTKDGDLLEFASVEIRQACWLVACLFLSKDACNEQFYTEFHLCDKPLLNITEGGTSYLVSPPCTYHGNYVTIYDMGYQEIR